MYATANYYYQCRVVELPVGALDGPALLFVRSFSFLHKHQCLKGIYSVLRYGRAAIQVGMECNADGVVVGATLEAEVFIA